MPDAVGAQLVPYTGVAGEYAQAPGGGAGAGAADAAGGFRAAFVRSMAESAETELNVASRLATADYVNSPSAAQHAQTGADLVEALFGEAFPPVQPSVDRLRAGAAQLQKYPTNYDTRVAFVGAAEATAELVRAALRVI